MKTAIIILIILGFFGLIWLLRPLLNRDFRRKAGIVIGDELLSEDPNKPPSKPVAQQTPELWKVTAYCPCAKCCGEFADGFTASGELAVGRIIAAPPEIPFGTTIFIKGYGYGRVQDRGGAIKGKRLDVLFPTHQQALEWGVKYLEIKL